jgi:hypothetical protein
MEWIYSETKVSDQYSLDRLELALENRKKELQNALFYNFKNSYL